ncbi:MAG: tetratricopeptide repeat protein [Thiobacillus sp.]|nr:tetratricopeptide repeat protein [Thiobacillus sp.]
MTFPQDDQDIQQALRLGHGYLQSGRVQLADMIFQQVLAKYPAHVDALHLAALSSFAQGHHAVAADLLERAVKLAPERPELHNDLGECRRAAGDLDKAMAAYRASLELRPDYAEARNNLGVALRQAGRAEEAVEAFEAALASRPDYPEAAFNLGVTLEDLGRHEASMPHLQSVLERTPDNPVALERLAHACMALALEDEAMDHFGALTLLLPESFEAWYALGGLQQRRKLLPEALVSLERAVALKPDHPWARFHLGMVLDDLERPEAALEQMQASDRLSPDNPATLTRIAILLRSLRRLDEAEDAVHRALAVKPDSVHALNALGLVELSRRHWGQASAAFMAASEVRPDMALPLVNMASLYGQKGDFARRRHYFGLALERAPGDDQIRFSYALTQLLMAEWAEAWRNYAHRPNITRTSDYDLLEAPLPTDLQGKRILVQMDQGLGDELLFLRFAQVLKARGAWVAYRPNPKLASFVGKLPFIDMAVSHRETPEHLDYRLAVCDLALAVDMREVTDIPPPVMLTPSPGSLGQARRLLAPLGDGPFIGVTWRGGTSKEEFSKWNVLYKEIDLDLLAERLRDMPGQVLVLQRKPKAGEIERFAAHLGRPVHDLTGVNEQLEVMLALLSLIDEYVAVSNTNVHLRAGAGRISRVLIPHPPDWRWMTSGRSPWYPDIPTYREAPGGEGWSEALEVLHSDLLKTIKGDPS